MYYLRKNNKLKAIAKTRDEIDWLLVQEKRQDENEGKAKSTDVWTIGEE